MVNVGLFISFLQSAVVFMEYVTMAHLVMGPVHAIWDTKGSIAIKVSIMAVFSR